MKPIDAPGWTDLVTWFGGEPNFHDSEVVAIDLSAGSPACVVRIHAWRVLPEVDERGAYRTDRHATVSFVMDDIVSLELRDWMRQNVLFGLMIENGASGWSLTFDSSCGLDGGIVARTLRIEVAPYQP